MFFKQVLLKSTLERSDFHNFTHIILWCFSTHALRSPTSCFCCFTRFACSEFNQQCRFRMLDLTWGSVFPIPSSTETKDRTSPEKQKKRDQALLIKYGDLETCTSNVSPKLYNKLLRHKGLWSDFVLLICQSLATYAASHILPGRTRHPLAPVFTAGRWNHCLSFWKCGRALLALRHVLPGWHWTPSTPARATSIRSRNCSSRDCSCPGVAVGNILQGWQRNPLAPVRSLHSDLQAWLSTLHCSWRHGLRHQRLLALLALGGAIPWWPWKPLARSFTATGGLHQICRRSWWCWLVKAWVDLIAVVAVWNITPRWPGHPLAPVSACQAIGLRGIHIATAIWDILLRGVWHPAAPIRLRNARHH